MITQEYRQNRARIPRADLVKFQGAWVAFSSDGRRVVASGTTLQQLEEEIAAKGESGQNTVLEWLPGPEDDSFLGAGE